MLDIILNVQVGVLAYVSEIPHTFTLLGGGVPTLKRRGPAQDVPFFYTPSNLSRLQSCKSIISTKLLLFLYFTILRHKLVIELCLALVIF